MQVLHDFGHVPMFGCIAVLILIGVRARNRVPRRTWEYAIAFVAAVACGVLVEILQMPLGRNASWQDVRSDIFGAASFLAMFAAMDRRLVGIPWRWPVAAFGAGILAFQAHPLIRASLEYYDRNESFPVLLDVSRHYNDYFLTYHEAAGEHEALPREFAFVEGERALHLFFEARWAPYLAIFDTKPDWRQHRWLMFDLTNPNPTPAQIKIGVEDRTFDDTDDNRFVKIIDLPAHERVVARVSLIDVAAGSGRRSLDLSQIARVLLLDQFAKAPRDFYVSRVWLE